MHHPKGFSRSLLGRLCIRGLFAIAIAAGLWEAAGVRPAQAQDVSSCIQTIGNAMMQAAQNGSQQAFYSVIDQYADNETIALLALGQYRKLLPPDRKDAFVDLVEQFVAKTLADNYRKFRATAVVITGSRAQGNSINVDTSLKFLGGRPSQKVTWRVVPDGDSCKVLDVNVTNVWLGQLLKSSVTSAIQSGGQTIDAAFTYLQPSAGRGSSAVKMTR